MNQLDRRTFLRLGGVGLASVAFIPVLGGCETRTGPEDPPLTRDGFVPFITPTSQFYVQHGGRDTIDNWAMPDVSREAWVCDIVGQGLTTPLAIDWAQMQAAIDAGKSRRILKTMRCILDSHVRPGATGWTGNAIWAGVPLRHFLDQVGLITSGQQRLVFTGYDSFSNNITIERYGASDQGAMEPLLVYEMNNAPLLREHGGPVRLLLLEGYGYKSVKWLKRINASLVDDPIGTYQREGFDDEAIIGITGRSLNMIDGVTVRAGLVEITGYALSGHAAIASVEISIDEGEYVRAALEPVSSLLASQSLPSDVLQLQDPGAYPYRAVWTQWRYRWQAPKGDHIVAIRATDAAGNTQPEDDDYDLTDGLSSVVRYTVTVE